MSENGTILLVEDDKFTARMMELRLQQNGFVVKHAPDAEEALAILADSPVDIVLSDMMMPRVSGLELLRKIRETHDRTSLPFILLTASDDGAKVKEAVRLGANDFFTKTEDFSVLLTRITLQIALKKATEAAARSEEPEGRTRSSADGLWDWRMGKGTVHFSSVWKANLGFGPEELAPEIETWFERIHPEDDREFHEMLRAHLARQQPWLETDHRLLGKDGRYRWVHVFGIAFFNKSGEPVRMIGSMHAVQEPHLGRGWDRLGDTLNHLEKELRSFQEKSPDEWNAKTADTMLETVRTCLDLMRQTLPDRLGTGGRHAGDEATM